MVQRVAPFGRLGQEDRGPRIGLETCLAVHATGSTSGTAARRRSRWRFRQGSQAAPRSPGVRVASAAIRASRIRRLASAIASRRAASGSCRGLRHEPGSDRGIASKARGPRLGQASVSRAANLTPQSGRFRKSSVLSLFKGLRGGKVPSCIGGVALTPARRWV